MSLIAQLFVRWTQELKEPICGEIKQFFQDAEGNPFFLKYLFLFIFFCFLEIENEELFVHTIHTLVHTLSTRNFNVLKFIVHLLNMVNQFSSINKISLNELANLWGPIFFGELNKNENFKTMKVLYNFEKKEDNQLTVVAGQRVVFIKQTDLGWSLVSYDTNVGYVPTSYLSQVEKKVHGIRTTSCIIKNFDYIFQVFFEFKQIFFFHSNNLSNEKNEHKEIGLTYKNSREPNTVRISSASLESIFYKLMDQYFMKLIDPQFQDVFLLTHTYFLNDEKLLSEFISWYKNHIGDEKWK